MLLRLLILSSLFFSLLYTSCKKGNKIDATTEVEVVEPTGYPQIDNLTDKIFKDPNDSDLLYLRSIEYANLEAYDNAITDMYVAMRMDSMVPKYYIHLADVFVDYARSTQALETLRLGVERFPRNKNILLRYAELNLALRQNQRAIQTIQQVLEIDPQNKDAYFLMGILMKEEGDLNRAKGAFRQVIDIDPEVIDAYLLLSELHENDNKELSLQYLNNALTIEPENISALHSMAFYLQNNNEVEDALDYYDQIITLNSNYPPAFLNAGILQLERGENEMALEKFNILVGIDPTGHLGYFYRGIAEKNLGDLESAKKDFEQALNFKADFKKAKDELTRMKI